MYFPMNFTVHIGTDSLGIGNSLFSDKSVVKRKSKSVAMIVPKIDTYNAEYEKIKNKTHIKKSIPSSGGSHLVEKFVKPEIKDKMASTSSLLKTKKQVSSIPKSV